MNNHLKSFPLFSALLELFDETMGIFVRDERALFRPAGLARFARRRGGQLE